MIFSAHSLQISFVEDGIALLTFDNKNKLVNTLDKATLLEFESAIHQLKNNSHVKGLILNSKKDSFIVGADINEFIPLFQQGDAKVKQWLQQVNELFCELEDLPFPTLSAINGYALGGGCECVLATDFRIGNKQINIGLPEVKLGIIPGFGGTVRMPRVIGADNAIELICSGKTINAQQAQKIALLDAVVEEELLLSSSLIMIKQAMAGHLNWQERRQFKTGKLRLQAPESTLSFATAKALISAKSGSHYPAPLAAVNAIETAADKSRNEALDIELDYFLPLTKQASSHALISIYQQDQQLKHKAKLLTKNVETVNSCSVIGAGIMGGGIAYQCAGNQIPVVMKDISSLALEQGLAEAAKLLVSRVKSGRLTSEKMASTLNLITASQSFSVIKNSDIIIEAVVENSDIKQQVLAELEQKVSEQTILCSNTSTIPISSLAKNLCRPDFFCGMHFFNPVHRMPLVEIIRGDKSSENTIATVVQLALDMKKIPIVVNDCPGFFVNRVLFPYLFGFCQLVAQGVSFHLIDKVMEDNFGWPMGPAYLLDVIGIDTAHHAAAVMAEAYPNRMSQTYKTVIDLFYGKGLLGQKTGQGFYNYQNDENGRPIKTNNITAEELIKKSTAKATNNKEIQQSIINTMMIPMLNEVALCLEEGVVASAGEADMALIYGLGFPAFHGGALRYLDTIGLNQHIKNASDYRNLSAIYHVPQSLVDMAKNDQLYYPKPSSQPKGAIS